MKEILNNHQILYVKNFYKHSGDIIRDMQKVCKLDCPKGNFSSPEKILNFMREQFINWLDATPEVHKEVGSKVAWEKDPVKAEIWSILISYTCFIPMTNIGGWIKGLPDYNAMAPQYNCYMNGVYERPFKREMSIEEKTAKAKEILNMPMVKIMDPLANKLMKMFNFRKASKIMTAFGVEKTPEELDNELWDLYSDVVEDNSEVVDGEEVLDNGYFTVFSEHFRLDMRSKIGIHDSIGLEVQLCPMKWAIISDKETSEKTFRSDYKELSEKLFRVAKITASEIAVVCSTLKDKNFEIPEYLTVEDEVEENMKESLGIFLEYWKGDEYSRFEAKGKSSPMGYGSGSFKSYVFNENGKIKIDLAFQMLFECSIYEKSFYSYRSAFTNDIHD